MNIELKKLRNRKKIFNLIEKFNFKKNEIRNKILNPITYFIYFKMIKEKGNKKEEEEEEEKENDLIEIFINFSQYLECSLRFGFIEDLNEEMIIHKFNNENHFINDQDVNEIINIWFENDISFKNMKICNELYSNLISISNNNKTIKK